MKFGYFLSSEEHGPRSLIDQAKAAEEAGFDALWISDHFHPWNDEQGESPFVWSVIGALGEVTALPVTTAVTCPTIRVHPAVVAQAAATSALMCRGGFRLGVGSGEALNEHVTGARWPSAEVRLEMLEEAVEVMNTAPDPSAIESYRKQGGTGPTMAGAKACYGPSREESVKTAHRLWSNAGVPGELAQVLPSPRHFEQAAQLVPPEKIGESMPCGPDPDEHLEKLGQYVEAGYDELYISQVGEFSPDFFEFYGSEVLPALRKMAG